MAKKIDDRVKEILTKHGFDWKECLWDCHGVWVMYHRYIEIAGSKNNVVYDLHEVESNSKDGYVAVKCVANMGDARVVTYGEASPKNCKNAYLYAMAEKRAVDRAVLKLLGLHGFIYSEDEIEKKDKEPEVEFVPDPIILDDEIDELKKQLDKANEQGNLKEVFMNFTPVAKEMLRSYVNDIRFPPKG